MALHRGLLKASVVGVLLMLCSSCKSEMQSVMGTLDCLIFKLTGVTFLADPATVSIKELRLAGNQSDEEVLIEGNVEELSENSTYFVISDDSARLLVVTTDLSPKMTDVVFRRGAGTTVKVMGKVELGKKGLPYLRASALTTAGIDTVEKTKS